MRLASYSETGHNQWGRPKSVGTATACEAGLIKPQFIVNCQPFSLITEAWHWTAAGHANPYTQTLEPIDSIGRNAGWVNISASAVLWAFSNYCKWGINMLLPIKIWKIEWAKPHDLRKCVITSKPHPVISHKAK